MRSTKATRAAARRVELEGRIAYARSYARSEAHYAVFCWHQARRTRDLSYVLLSAQSRDIARQWRAEARRLEGLLDVA